MHINNKNKSWGNRPVDWVDGRWDMRTQGMRHRLGKHGMTRQAGNIVTRHTNSDWDITWQTVKKRKDCWNEKKQEAKNKAKEEQSLGNTEHKKHYGKAW